MVTSSNPPPMKVTPRGQGAAKIVNQFTNCGSGAGSRSAPEWVDLAVEAGFWRPGETLPKSAQFSANSMVKSANICDLAQPGCVRSELGSRNTLCGRKLQRELMWRKKTRTSRGDGVHVAPGCGPKLDSILVPRITLDVVSRPRYIQPGPIKRLRLVLEQHLGEW